MAPLLNLKFYSLITFGSCGEVSPIKAVRISVCLFVCNILDRLRSESVQSVLSCHGSEYIVTSVDWLW